MLETIGVSSIEELFGEIPENLRLREALNVPSGLDEHRLGKHLAELASRNMDLASTTCFLGAGIYDRFVPATVGAVLSRGEFLTAYTPYQPEASQGYLQTIYEFQTMIANLYGCDLANASMYDGATAMAEAAIVAVGAKNRQKVAVSRAVHPHFRDVLRTYCWALDVEVVEVDASEGTTRESDLSDCAAFVVQTPNFFGVLEDVESATNWAHEAGALLVAVADPIAMVLVPPPGELGADFVVGEGQPLGISMGFGGPLLGLFACKQEFARRIPGRIVGRSKDAQGRSGYTMTLRTREQDIRREKATSNICTNEALMALAATVYLTALGKNGLRSVAESTVRNAQYALAKLEEAGARRRFDGKVFGEVALRLPKPPAQVRGALLEEGILAGLPLGQYYPELDDCLLVAVTELRTREEIDRFAEALAKQLA